VATQHRNRLAWRVVVPEEDARVVGGGDEEVELEVEVEAAAALEQPEHVGLLDELGVGDDHRAVRLGAARDHGLAGVDELD